MAELDKVLENEQRVENNKQQAENLYNTAANVQGGNDEWLNEMQGKLNAVKPKQQAQPTTNDAWLDEQQKKLDAVGANTGNGRITSLPDTTPLPEPAENAPKAQGTRKAFAGVTQEDLDAVSEENARLEKLPYRQADSYIMEESNGEVKLHQGGRTFVFPSYDAYNNYFSGKAGPESYKVYGAKEHVFDPNNEVYVSNLYKNWGAGIFPAGNEDITKALKFDAYKVGNAGDGVEVDDDYSDLTVGQLESKIDELIGDIKNGYDKGTTEKRLTLARLELAAKKKGYKNAKEAKSHPNLFRYQLMNEAIAKWYPSEFSPYLLDDSYSVPYADLMGANPLKTYFGSFNLEDHEPITVDENGNVILGLPKGVKRTTHNIYGGTTTFKSEYENIQDAKNALGEDGNDYAKEGHSMGDYDIWDKEGNPTNPLAIINKYLMSDNKFSRAYTGWVALVTKMTGQSPTKVWEDGIKDYVGDVFNHREKVRKWKMESLAKDTRERLGWMAPLAVGADGTILSKLFEFGIRTFADEDTRHTMNVMDEAYGQIGDILRKEGFWNGYAIPISTSFAGDFPFFMGSGKLAQLSTKGTLKGLGQAGTKQMAKELRSALMKQTMSKIEGKVMMSGFNLGFYSLMSQTASDLSQLKFSGLIPYAEAFGSGFVGGSSLAFGGAAAAKMRMRPTNLFKATANRFSGAFAELSALTAPQWLEASLSGEMGKEGYIYSSLMSNVCMMGSCKGQALLMGGAKSPASKKTSEKTIKELRDKGYDAIADDLERRNKLHIKASGGEFLLELSEAGEEQMRRLSEDMEETGKGVAWDTFAELSGAMGYGVIPPGASDVRMIENGDGTFTVQAVDDKGRAITSGKTYTADERAEAEKEHKELSALVPVIVENRNRTLYDSQAIQYVYAETCRRIADSINEGKSVYDENGNIRDDYSGCTANDVAQALSAIDLIPENRRTKEQKEFFDYYSSISKEMMEEVQSAADIRDIMCEQYGISEKEFDDCMEKAPDERGNGKAAQAVEAFNKVMSDGFYASSSTSIGYAEHNGKFVEIYRAEPDVLYVRERNADGTLGNLKEIPRSEAENIHGETDPGWVHDADVQAKREADMESAIREYSYLTEDQLREVYNDRKERLKSGVSEEEAQEIAVELAVMDMAAAEKGYDLGKRSEEKPLPQDETNQTSSATDIDLEPPANDSAETPDVIESEGESAPTADPLRRKKAEAFLDSFFSSMPKEDKEKLIDYYASREDLDSIISEHLEKTNDDAGKAAYDEALKRIYKYGEEEIGLVTRQPETPKPENEMQPAEVETEPKPKVEETPVDNSQPKDRIDELLDAMGFEGEERAEQRAFYEDKNNAEQFEKDYSDFVGAKEPQPQEPQPKEEVKTEDKKEETVDDSQQEPEIVDDLDAPMPMKKVRGKDKPDYSKTTPRKGHDYLVNKSGLEKEEVLDKVDYEISKAKNKVKALEKKQPSIKDKRFDGDEDEYLQAKAEWQNELNAAKAEQEYWEEVQEIEKVQGSINEIDGAKSWTSVRDVFNKIRSRFSTDPKIRNLIDSFTPQTLYDACMDYLSGGVRFIWYGDKNNKGLQQEKGWGEEERKNHIGMIASKEKGGITPQKAVHDIVDLYGQDLGLTLDQGKEIFDTLIDALDGISTRGDAADYIRRRKLEAVRDELARRLEGETNTYDTAADRYYDEEFEALKEQYKDELPENPTEDDVISLMEKKRQEAEEPQPVNREQKSSQERGRRRGGFFNMSKEKAPQGSPLVQEKFNEEKERFRAEAERNKMNDYASVLAASNTPEEAIAEWRKRAEKARAEADDWRNRKYKTNNTVVTGENRYSAGDEYQTTIGAANERRRQGRIRNLEETAKTYESYIETLKQRTGYEERTAKAAEEVEAADDNIPNETGVSDDFFENGGEEESVPFQKGETAKPAKAETKQARDFTARTIKKLRKAGVKVKVATQAEAQRVRELAEKVGAQLQAVFHGSANDFDAFDHSHMGEGEGAQAYGWGTYVTQVEGIGRTYAKSSAAKSAGIRFRGADDVTAIEKMFPYQNPDSKPISREIINIIRDIRTGYTFDEAKSYAVESRKNWLLRHQNALEEYRKGIEAKEKIIERIENMSDEEYANTNFWDEANIAAYDNNNKENAAFFAWKRAAAIRTGNHRGRELTKEELLTELRKNLRDEKIYTLTDYEAAVKDAQDAYDFVNGLDESDFEVPNGGRFLYEVEIPDNDGTNYLPYNKKLSPEQGERLGTALDKVLIETKNERNQVTEEIRGLRGELEKKYGNDWPLKLSAEDKARYNKLVERQYVLKKRQAHLEDASKKIDNQIEFEFIQRQLESGFGERGASEFLHECGFVGIEYPAQYRSGGRSDNAKNYVIFNEGDAKITNKTEFLMTKDGTVYGWHDSEGIHLTEEGINPDTPVHEYTHGFMRMLKETDPKTYRRVVEGLKESEVWQEVLDDPEYVKIRDDEDAVASEVNSRLSGRENTRRVNTEFDKDNIFSVANAVAVKERVKNALKDFWDWVCIKCGGWVDKKIPAERIASMSIRALNKGVNPDAIVEEAVRPIEGLLRGDSQITKQERIQVRNALESAEATPATINSIVARDDMSARNVAMEWVSKNIPEPITVSTEIGDLIINKKSISDSLAHGFSQAKLDAIPTLLPAFENKRAVYIGSGEDVNGNPITDHYFAYPIDYNGERDYVFCRTREDQNTHRLYIHEVITKEDIINGQTLQSTALEKPRTGLPLYRKIMSFIFGDKVKPEFSVVQENGEKTTENVRTEPGRVELNAATLKDPVSRDYLKETMEKEGWGEAERKEFMRMLDDAADVVLEMGKRFPRLDDWNKREIASDKEGEIYKTMWRILNKKGQWIPNRNAFKKNGEYPWNIDLGTLCTKRESFDALVQLITEKGLAQNLGPTQIEGIKELLKSNGFLTACDICFNETKRARVISYANQVSNNWRVISEALGIKDKMVGDPIELTPEQTAILEQMAGRGYQSAFKKYIPEDQRREYKGEEKAGNEIDLGLTPAMMQKIAKQMLLDPTLVGKLKPETLITTEGMDWLLRTYGGHTKINELLASAWGSGTPKPIEGFNIYDPLSWREQYDQNRPGTKKRPEIDWFFNNGGFRAQSFTDYHPMLFLDYLQMFTDLGVRRLPIHIYTKVPALVKLFGGSGAKINMSLVPKMVDGVDAAHAGLKPDGKGGWEYAWDTDSFPIEEAFALRQDPRYGGNVGTIAVGLSDAHIRMMLADPTIDQVIPYHKSGMPESVQIKTGLKNATDYTEQQTTGDKPKGVKDFNFNEAVRKYGDPRRAAEEYVKWCEKNGYTPKFEQFKDDPNYYKLLADFRLFDGEGRYSEQKAVNPRNILQEGWETELENSLTDKTMQEQVKAQVGSNENLMKGVERLLGKQRMDGAVREEMVAKLKGALGKDNVESLKQNDFFDALEEAYSKTMGAEKAHEKVEVLRTNDGVVYGFAQGGKIVLNENVFNAETPIHEFTHIWVKVAQRENPKLWKKGKELLKQSDEWKEVMEDELYKDIHGDEDAVASEVLARIVGRDGADYVRRLLDPDSKPLKRGGVYNQIREWLNDLFKSVRSIFAPSIRNLTFDEFKKMPLNTLFDEAEAKRFLEAKNRLEKEGTLESDVTAGLELNATESSRDYAAEMRELMRRRLRGEDVTAELEQLRADRRAAEAARSAESAPATSTGGAGNGEPPVEPPTPPATPAPEPAPELPPTDYDRPMSPIEMAQAASIKAVADTKASLEQRNAARRELTASLRNIHKAMRIQKEYDRATVENVVSLCKMMVQSGLIDNRYVSNLTPLFTKLKDATGKQDLTSTVNDIMDVMLKSQERSVRNEIAKLLNTKGTKVDQNGVVTQAGLDIRGQHTMKELSEYMGKGSVIIDNHIAKLEEERSRIPDGHQERIDDIDDKILGSQLAKQFSEIEETHSVNISEAEQDLNFLKERYKAGEIGIKEYTEQKHVLENLIRSYRMAQTDALWNQANAMRHVIAGSKEGTRNWIEQQKQRKEDIRHDANSDMEGLSKQTQGDPTAKQRLMNMGIPRFLSSSLYTLQTMLKSLGGKHAMGEGYLYNRFFRGWMKNRDAEITEYRNDMNLLNRKAKEITGFKYFGLYDMIMMLPKMRVEYMDGGEMVPHELDQGQLGYAYMVNKMEDGAAALRNMGITEEKMQEISNFLNPNLKKFYDWLQDDFLAGKWEGMNEVHRRMFGADMDRVANYIPLHRDREAGTQKVDISQNGEPPLQSTVVGSIIQRVHSNLGIDIKHNNAVDVVAKHLLEATHWKHFSEWKRDANTLLSDTSFRNKVKNSDTIYGSGDQLWSRLNDVFKIAGGDYSTPADRKFKVNESVINMARAVNAAKVSMRVFTATKQLLSLPVFATECNTATLMKNLGFLLSPDKTSGSPTQNSFVWCLQNLPQFRERVMSRTSGETRLENGDLGWGFSRQRVFENAARIGLAPNAFIDACTVAAGAKSIYEKRFAQYKKNGYSEKAADEKAKIDAETAFNESQQSSEKAFVSPIQVDRDAVSLGLSTFRNASMGYERKFVDAVRNFKHLTMGGKEYRDTLVKRKEKELIEQGMDKAEARAAAEKEYKWVPGAKVYREVTMEFMKKQMMRDGLTETQAKAAAERLYRRALWRSTLNFLMFGFGAQMAWNVGGKLPYLIFGDNDEEKKRILKQAAVHAGIGGWVEGLPTGDMLSEGMTNWAMNLIDNGNPLEGASFFEFDPDLLTLTSDVVKVTKALEGPNPLKGATTFVNLLGQILTGVNPETFTDAGVAIYDACNGDPETSNEALMCVLRIMQCPQSQLDQMYIDELRMSAREAQGLTPEEVARRYAYYKAHKDTPYMWWIYNQGKKDEIVKKYEENFNKKLNEDVKEDGGTAEDYHDLMESATTKKEHDKYMNKEIAELSARGPEALMKAWDKEHAKGADADYKYMRSLMSRYQKDVYGEEKVPESSDVAYEAVHGEDLDEQAEKIGRDLGFEAQDSYYQMSQFKTQNAPSKNRVMKAWGETGASFRYTEDGEFFDMDEYKVKLPVEDKAKRARAMKLVEENKEEMQRIYRNAWRMKKISALYKTADELKKKWEINLMFIPAPTIDLKDAKAISDAYKEVQQLLNDEATDREMDRKAKKKGFLNQ